MKTTIKPQANPALVFIFPKDVLRILTHLTTYDGAWCRLKRIKKCLGKERHQHLTIQEFADWEGLNAQDILNVLAAA